MDEKQAGTIKELMSTVLSYNPEMVILFGSTARGEADEFSDIDMLILLQTDKPEAMARKIKADTDHIAAEKDIKVITPDEYYNQRDIPGTILFPILNEGIVLYKKPGFKKDVEPSIKYEERKRNIIKKEFIEQAFAFMEKAEAAIEKNNMFRFRDYMRFALLRALKAVFVLKDIHPPRETDPGVLLEKATDLHPVVRELTPLIKRLKEFYPDVDNMPPDDPRELLDTASYIIRRVNKVLS